MIEITEYKHVILTITVCLPRMLTAFAVIPFLGGQVINGLVRNSILLSYMLVLYPMLAPTIPADLEISFSLVAVLFKEIVIGMLIGFFAGILFWVAQGVGYFIDNQRGASMAAIIVGIYAFIWIFWDFYREEFKELMLLPAACYGMPFKEALTVVLNGALTRFISLSAPIVGLAMVLGLVSNYAQVGVLFSFEAIKPDLNKINPTEGVKKIFSMNNLMELVKSMVKILFLGYLVYKVIRGAIDPLTRIPLGGIDQALALLGSITQKIAVFSAGAFILVAVADYFLQRFQHTRKLKMTKDEVKKEHKEMEGDPIIKGKRKQLHRELAMNDAVERSRKAGVIVTNPTRLAIALYYDKEEGKLPLILAKGENLLAKRIVEVAREEGIPVMQNIPLARNLFEHGRAEQYIPSDLIEPVVEVLRWVRQVTQG
ncbi:MAG: EscU/YscU/HrcU family type III secretion system export apparatus switch protein [Desulfobacteraceae bacterium]|nr:EscU/YscU/HrcU family type III secretion system export apparatus switch protein [Desulfobacteraceae bacterium]